MKMLRFPQKLGVYLCECFQKNLEFECLGALIRVGGYHLHIESLSRTKV